MLASLLKQLLGLLLLLALGNCSQQTISDTNDRTGTASLHSLEKKIDKKNDHSEETVEEDDDEENEEEVNVAQDLSGAFLTCSTTNGHTIFYCGIYDENGNYLALTPEAIRNLSVTSQRDTQNGHSSGAFETDPLDWSNLEINADPSSTQDSRNRAPGPDYLLPYHFRFEIDINPGQVLSGVNVTADILFGEISWSLETKPPRR